MWPYHAGCISSGLPEQREWPHLSSALGILGLVLCSAQQAAGLVLSGLKQTLALLLGLRGLVRSCIGGAVEGVLQQSTPNVRRFSKILGCSE